MCHFVQDAACAIIVIICASGRILGELPISVVRARYDVVGAGHGVQERAAVGAVAVGVGARDSGGGGLHTRDAVVDGAHLAFLGGGLEPDGEVVGGRAGSGVCSACHGDGIRDAGLQRAGLGRAAGVIGYRALLDAGGAGDFCTLGDVVTVQRVRSNITVDLAKEYILGSFALVRCNGDGLGAGGLAEGRILDRVGSRSSYHVLEALNGADLSRLDAGQLVRPGRIDSSSDAFTGCKCLKHIGRETTALVVDIDALEGNCLSGYQYW